MLIGKRLIKEQYDISEIVVYKQSKTGEFVPDRQLEFEFDEFTCVQFFFNKKNSNELLFFTATEIFKFNFNKDQDQEETVYTMQNFLLDPPSFGIFNDDQSICIVTSRKDILFINIETKLEVDIDEKENISDILNIVGDDKYFYVLANKKNQFLGYYLLMVDIANPE